ncbi:Ribokinase-like protein [Setomelanomma holmii]|uniref:Ribokinase-like protein n=1 Tax=Setomelanomma holmii TaxID=210430 RepID=A0A9P4HFJ4_9PLEO|nr:Ribokinase-like protein [Setomelanomma holmii]
MKYPQLGPQVLDFVSLGMVVLDEIRTPGWPPLTDVVGGSGAFATLGARLFNSGIPVSKVQPGGLSRLTWPSKNVGCMVRAGHDFPEHVLQELDKGLLEYQDNTFGPKTFTYTTEPLKTKPIDLIDTPLLKAKIFHFLATPDEIMQLVPQLREARRKYYSSRDAIVIWEPLPDSCTEDMMEHVLLACELVQIFSPNHIEAGNLFGYTGGFEKERIETYAKRFVSCIGIDNEDTRGIVVIRYAEHGSLTVDLACRIPQQTIRQKVWLPPFYPSESPKVVEATGAGNAFLGGFAVGLIESRECRTASVYDHIAASFAVEQIGLPRLELQIGDDGETRPETWNGVGGRGRLADYEESFVDDDHQFNWCRNNCVPPERG